MKFYKKYDIIIIENKDMDKNKQIKELRDKTGCGFLACRKAIEYCDKHPNCSPLGYLHTAYSGVKYSDFDKAVIINSKYNGW